MWSGGVDGCHPCHPCHPCLTCGVQVPPRSARTWDGATPLEVRRMDANLGWRRWERCARARPLHPMRIECVPMAPVMPHRDSRQRAEQAFRLRSLGYTWRAVADHLGYRSAGAAQTAVNRHLDRTPPESSEAARRSASERLQITSTILAERLFQARESGDDDRLVAVSKELRNTTAELAKLNGLNVPVAQQVDLHVSTSATAIIDRMEAELLALVAQRKPQLAIPGVIEGEVIR